MKKIFLKYTLIFTVLTAVLLIIACDQGTRNTNVAQSQNTNTNVAKAAPITEALGDTCEGTLEEKLKKLQEKLEKRFKDDKDIGDQLGKGWFKFKVDKVTGIYASRIVLYVEGKIIGNDHFPDLLKIVKDYMKKGCLEKVTFLPAGSIPAAGTFNPPPDGVGFEWIACEDPMVPCPGGYCDLPSNCGSMAANTNATAPANSNSGSNSAPVSTRSP